MNKSDIDPKNVKLAATVEIPTTLYSLCYDQRNGQLFGAGTDWTVYELNVDNQGAKAQQKWTHHENYVSSLVLIGDVVISGGYDRRLIWTSPADGKLLRAIKAHDGWVRDLATFPDGKRIVSVGDDMLVKVWTTQTGESAQTFDGHAKKTPQGFATALYTVAVSPDGKFIASGDRIGEVCVWDVEKGKLAHRLKASAFYTFDAVKRARSIGGIRSLCFSTDGARLAISGIGQVTNVDGFVGPCRVEVWDWKASKKVFTGQHKHKAILNHVAFHDDMLIAAGGGDNGGILAFWNQKNEQPIHMVKPKGHLHRFVVDRKRASLFAAGYNGFQIWKFGDSGS